VSLFSILPKNKSQTTLLNYVNRLTSLGP
jgi:hypothetical protein